MVETNSPKIVHSIKFPDDTYSIMKLLCLRVKILPKEIYEN